jgi:hypothetical protein
MFSIGCRRGFCSVLSYNNIFCIVVGVGFGVVIVIGFEGRAMMYCMMILYIIILCSVCRCLTFLFVCFVCAFFLLFGNYIFSYTNS